jgi:hypothetical protein
MEDAGTPVLKNNRAITSAVGRRTRARREI